MNLPIKTVRKLGVAAAKKAPRQAARGLLSAWPTEPEGSAAGVHDRRQDKEPQSPVV